MQLEYNSLNSEERLINQILKNCWIIDRYIIAESLKYECRDCGIHHEDSMEHIKHFTLQLFELTQRTDLAQRIDDL